MKIKIKNNKLLICRQRNNRQKLIGDMQLPESDKNKKDHKCRKRQDGQRHKRDLQPSKPRWMKKIEEIDEIILK